MECYTAAICDNDEIYRRKLAEYFMRHTKLSLRMMTFSEEGILKKGQREAFDLLICSEGFYVDRRSEFENVQVNHMILLRENEEMGRAFNSLPWFNRYGSIKKLLELGESILTKERRETEDDADFMCENRAEAIKAMKLAIVSPVSRCGKTSFAYMLAKSASEQNRVLFISFDCDLKLFSAEEKNMTELLYELGSIGTMNSITDSLISVESYFRQYEQFMYIPVPKNRKDLLAITPGILEELLKLCRPYFEVIVVDFGNILSDMSEILLSFDRIFIPVLSDVMSEMKKSEWEDNIKEQDMELLKKKMYYLELPPVPEADSDKQYFRELCWSAFGKRAEEIWNQSKKSLKRSV